MYFEYNEEVGITEVYSETDDICVMCKYFDFCPLIGALEQHTVYHSDNEIYIEDCPMYAPYVDEASVN